jgi:hypothetical protein
MPQLPSRILDRDVKNIGIADPSIDNRPAHRAQDVERRRIERYYGCH